MNLNYACIAETLQLMAQCSLYLDSEWVEKNFVCVGFAKRPFSIIPEWQDCGDDVYVCVWGGGVDISFSHSIP